MFEIFIMICPIWNFSLETKQKNITQIDEWFKIPRVFSFLALSGMDIGKDSLSPVSNEYDAPFEFTGEIYHLLIEIVGEKSNEPYLLDD